MNFVDFIFRQYYNGNNLIDRGKGDMKNIFDLTGKRALVTGSTQGIGYAIAKALHENGAEVYIHCSSDDCKAKQVAAIGTTCLCFLYTHHFVEVLFLKLAISQTILNINTHSAG